MKDSKKLSRGITLISLVITIIVLIILAGVVILMLTGENSIIKNADISVINTLKGQFLERANMVYSMKITNNIEVQEVSEEEVMEELRNCGYLISDQSSTVITNITTSTSEVKLIKGIKDSDEIIIDTESSSEEDTAYYVKLRQKYYPIIKDNLTGKFSLGEGVEKLEENNNYNLDDINVTLSGNNKVEMTKSIQDNKVVVTLSLPQTANITSAAEPEASLNISLENYNANVTVKINGSALITATTENQNRGTVELLSGEGPFEFGTKVKIKQTPINSGSNINFFDKWQDESGNVYTKGTSYDNLGVAVNENGELEYEVSANKTFTAIFRNYVTIEVISWSYPQHSNTGTQYMYTDGDGNIQTGYPRNGNAYDTYSKCYPKIGSKFYMISDAGTSTLWKGVRVNGISESSYTNYSTDRFYFIVPDSDGKIFFGNEEGTMREQKHWNYREIVGRGGSCLYIQLYKE